MGRSRCLWGGGGGGGPSGGGFPPGDASEDAGSLVADWTDAVSGLGEGRVFGVPSSRRTTPFTARPPGLGGVGGGVEGESRPSDATWRLGVVRPCAALPSPQWVGETALGRSSAGKGAVHRHGHDAALVSSLRHLMDQHRSGQAQRAPRQPFVLQGRLVAQ